MRTIWKEPRLSDNDERPLKSRAIGFTIAKRPFFVNQVEHRFKSTMSRRPYSGARAESKAPRLGITVGFQPDFENSEAARDFCRNAIETSQGLSKSAKKSLFNCNVPKTYFAKLGVLEQAASIS